MLTVPRSNDTTVPLSSRDEDPLPAALAAADECARAVMDTVPAVMRRIRERMRHHDPASLSIPQFRVLGFLDRNPGACLSELSSHLGVARPTASIIVDRLVQRRLVTRSDDPRERRRLALGLTPDGLQLLQQARSATRAWIATLLRSLPEERLQQMAAGLALLGGAFKAGATPQGSHPEPLAEDAPGDHA
jgi:DNA-binding MarR family transcriptional regulator